jgi:hypothetical protein
MTRPFDKFLLGAAAVLVVALAVAGQYLAPSATFAAESKMSSAAFERFRFSFFEDPNSPRDTLDTAALTQLEGDERARAEDMLLNYLPDIRGVIGLGVLRSRRAEPRLALLFETERGSVAWIYIARSLWQIRPNPRWLAAM